MKTLIYALCAQGHGTERLAKALTNLGLVGGHEITGSGTYGSITPVSNQLSVNFYSRGDYSLGEPIGGYTGDNKLAEAFFRWNKIRFMDKYPEEVKELRVQLLEALSTYVYGDGFFVDIGAFIADWYPLVEDLANSGIFRTRSIHLTKDGREWVQKLMFYKTATVESSHYGSVHNEYTIYPPIVPGTEGLTRFEQVCHMWSDLHSWFYKGGRKIVHVEDFNTPETADMLLEELFPEADQRQREAFSLVDEAYSEDGHRPHLGLEQGPWGFKSYDAWDSQLKGVFDSICGPMMRTLGYWEEARKEEKSETLVVEPVAQKEEVVETAVEVLTQEAEEKEDISETSPSTSFPRRGRKKGKRQIGRKKSKPVVEDEFDEV